jgi:hypothetical protein
MPHLTQPESDASNAGMDLGERFNAEIEREEGIKGRE